MQQQLPARPRSRAGARRVEAILLGSSPGVRRLDPRQSVPISLRSVDAGATVLDWALHALRENGIDRTTLVGGYHIQKIIQRYPDLSYRFHRGWREEGELAALRLADPDARDQLIIRASAICLPSAVNTMLAPPEETLVVGRVAAGVAMLSLPASRVAEMMTAARELAPDDPMAGLEAGLARLADGGVDIVERDLSPSAAMIDDRESVARLVFGGKAATLERVAPLLRTASVPDFVRVSVARWRTARQEVLGDVRAALGDGPVAVRSSTRHEDGLLSSGAGAFESVLDVNVGDAGAVGAAMDAVISSFGRDGRAVDPSDEVLVQRQVSDLAAAGVLLTRDPEGGGPYRVVSLERTGRSDGVTSGAEADIETHYLLREGGESTDPTVTGLLRLAAEIEGLTGLDALDIEFGHDRGGELHLFQVRPLTANARRLELDDADLAAELAGVRDFLDEHMRPHPALAGGTTVLGVMPDWNPAEMIGDAPRALALSLYQRLIGSSAWSAARARAGFRDVAPEPLIVSLAGRPYVDVRASLNSFLPAALPEEIGRAWVDHGLDRLGDSPDLHDKIEFTVAAPVADLDPASTDARMAAAGLDRPDRARFDALLRDLTAGALAGRLAPMDDAQRALDELARRRERWMAYPSLGATGLARRAVALVADCVTYGSVPFATLARHGFAAVALVRSLQRRGVLDGPDADRLLGAIPTVASDVSGDLARYARGELSRERMLAEYGHLRPSSYDITSPAFRDALDRYAPVGLDAGEPPARPRADEAATLFHRHGEAIDRLTVERGLPGGHRALAAYVLSAIPARERGKFELMKSVDAIIETLADLGSAVGLDREEMSHLPLSAVLPASADSASGARHTRLRRDVDFHAKRWLLTRAIRLPAVVVRPDDVLAHRDDRVEPNFVTTERVTAPTVLIDGPAPTEAIAGRIVLIRAADPGYDWIFSHRIAGLVTLYGGVASHMAIRAAEFRLPAAIGCGAERFARIAAARVAELDCAARRLEVVR